MPTLIQTARRGMPALILFAISAVGFAQRPGDLILTPTRIVLDEHSKSSDLSLLNRGARPIRYRLSLVDMEMSEEGTLRRTEAPSELSAISMLKLSPREIVLEPGVSQRIRIAAVLNPAQADGEFRAHLVFEPIAAPASAVAPQSDGSEALKLSLVFRSVVSIPVIVRHGHVAAAATLSDASVLQTPQGWFAKFTVHRTGNRSLRGDAKAEFTPAAGGPKVDLGLIAGLSVYCPNTDRIVTLKLKSDLAKLGPGRITIRFAEPDKSRNSIDVETQVSIPG